MFGFDAFSEAAFSDLPGGVQNTVGTAAGTSSATGGGTGLVFSTGSAVGSAAVSAPGREGWRSTGTAVGSASVQASTVIEAGAGAAAGSSSASAVGITGHFATGVINGISTVVGVGGTTPVIFDYFLTVISQYANSPILLQLIDNFFQYIDQTANMNAFYNLIWNVDTAQGYGLDVWGRIVGVSRTLNIEVGTYFGMTGPGGASGDPYNVSPFYAGGMLTTNFNLTDAAFRVLIFAKALSNISNSSVAAINQILRNLFGITNGNAYCTDGLDQTMTYTFDFVLTPVQAAIVGQTGILPKPAGVAASIVQV